MRTTRRIELLNRTGAGATLLVLPMICTQAEDLVPPSRWGPADEIGNANLLTEDKVKQAASLVSVGRVYSLGIKINQSTNLNPSRSYSLKLTQIQNLKDGGTAIDDTLSMSLGIGSQIDGLGHFGINGVHYNQNRVHDFFTSTGVTRLGVEKIPPIVARGVLLDLTKVLTRTQLAQGVEFGVAEIRNAEQAQGTDIRAGDVVLFNTGWLKRWQKGELGPVTGLSAEGAEYLAHKGVVAVGADNPGLDNKDTFPAHRVLLVKNGIYILEYIRTDELARDGVTQFMFVLGQPKIEGAVQSIINPVAIR